MREHLELPRPLRLLRTALWSLTESAGLPIGAAALGAWLYGRDAGLLAGLVATWLTALIRKIATGSVPSLLTISAVVLTLQTADRALHRPALALPAPVPGRQPGHVRALRADRARAQPAGGPARRRGGGPAPARPSPGPAPLLPGRDLALGRDLLPAHGRPGRADGDRAHQAVHHALDRAHGRPGGGRASACRRCGSGPSCAASASACASRPPDRPALPPRRRPQPGSEAERRLEFQQPGQQAVHERR